jgi:hypothetical protein
MKKLLTILILFSLQISFAQTTTYKNKSGDTIGHSKTKDNTTTYYNKSGNKTGTSKPSSNGATIYYNKQGNIVSKSKMK